MREDTKVWLYYMLIASVLVFFASVGVHYLDKGVCHAKTKGMGLNVEWSVFGGCRVEYESGKWIPLDSYVIIED